jgi:glyoxylase-like metal-dependent hydrolase (beta-lactamase superfamily II)
MKYFTLFRHFTFTALALLICALTFGQDNSPVVSPDSIYKATRVAHKVWQIMENKTVNIYVVEGKDSALIIDTGYGNGDLKSFVQTLTKLPLIVMNTHGHGDHIGGDAQFSRIYAHPEDIKMIEYGLKNAKKKAAVTPSFIPVKEGFVFNLGDRKIAVRNARPHTAALSV